MKKLNGTQIRNIAILVLILIFIWGQSMIPHDNSIEESDHFLMMIRSILGIDILDGLIIRKLAHFIEYSVLGVWMFITIKSFNYEKMYYSLNLCLFVAMIDETIQLFSNRGSKIADVWLDLAGSCFGIVLIYALIKIKKKK